MPRQRDFLASYDDDTVVEVVEAVDGVLHIVTYSDVVFLSGVSDVWVPVEGFPGQPRVRLMDAE